MSKPQPKLPEKGTSSKPKVNQTQLDGKRKLDFDKKEPEHKKKQYIHEEVKPLVVKTDKLPKLDDVIDEITNVPVEEEETIMEDQVVEEEESVVEPPENPSWKIVLGSYYQEMKKDGSCNFHPAKIKGNQRILKPESSLTTKDYKYDEKYDTLFVWVSEEDARAMLLQQFFLLLVKQSVAGAVLHNPFYPGQSKMVIKFKFDSNYKRPKEFNEIKNIKNPNKRPELVIRYKVQGSKHWSDKTDGQGLGLLFYINGLGINTEK